MAYKRRLNAAYVPQLPPSKQFGPGVIFDTLKSINPNTNITKDDLAQAAKAIALREAVKAGKIVYDKGQEYLNKRKGNKSPNRNKIREEGMVSEYGGYALSNSPSPVKAEFKSGIKPNVYVSDYQQAENGKCVPLHLTAARITFPTVTGQTLCDYFKEIIAFDVQSKAQANVSFNLNISTDFTTDKILSVMNDTIRAFQVYFSYNAILSYHSKPNNRNEGIIALRNSIDATALEKLSRLARRLMDTPIPPNLYKLIRFMSCIYTTGPIPGAPLIMVVPWGLDSSTALESNILDYVYNAICNTDYEEIFSLLRRSVPQWIPRTLEDLPVVPTYSANFSTVFANLPANGLFNGVTYPTVSVSDSTTDVDYCSYTNELDGVLYSLKSIWNTSVSRYEPGLIIPAHPTTGTSASFSTRRSFSSNNNGVHAFRYPKDDQDIIDSRPEVIKDIYDLTANYAYSATAIHLPATDKCKGVNINSVTETCFKAVDYLMSLDTIRPNLNKSLKGK